MKRGILLLLLLWSGPLAGLEQAKQAVVALHISQSPEEELRALRKGKLFHNIGTGVIISPNGWILTTARPLFQRSQKHVEVIFPSGRREKAQVWKVDLRRDIALLRLPQGKWPFFPMGDSRHLPVGSAVFALANPYGTITRHHQVAVTFGVVSDRYLLRSSQFVGEILEITAAVHEGAFGGALVDSQGKLIGILSSLYSHQRWRSSALPIHQIQVLLPLLQKKQPIPRGRLGVALREKLLPPPGRVLVEEVAPQSAAHLAGLRSGDQLTYLAQISLHSLKDVDRALEGLPPGCRIEVRWLRKGKRFHSLLELKAPSSQSSWQTITPGPTAFGLLLGRWKGKAYILAVGSGSEAYKKGIRPGDHIVALSGHKGFSIQELTQLLDKLSTVTLTLQRGRWQRTVTLRRSALPPSHWHFFPKTLAQFGLLLRSDGTVVEVRPHSLAVFYDIRVGDRIFSKKSSLSPIPLLLREGENTFWLYRQGFWKSITLVRPFNDRK